MRIGPHPLLTACLLVCAACDGDSRGASSTFADEYHARWLVGGIPRFVVYKRSDARNSCGWIVVVRSDQSDELFSAPDGWMIESGSLNLDREGCFQINPLGADGWPAYGSGALTFEHADSAEEPCSINVHG